jgi:hypothetical protein
VQNFALGSTWRVCDLVQIGSKGKKKKRIKPLVPRGNSVAVASPAAEGQPAHPVQCAGHPPYENPGTFFTSFNWMVNFDFRIVIFSSLDMFPNIVISCILSLGRSAFCSFHYFLSSKPHACVFSVGIRTSAHRSNFDTINNEIVQNIQMLTFSPGIRNFVF